MLSMLMCGNVQHFEKLYEINVPYIEFYLDLQPQHFIFTDSYYCLFFFRIRKGNYF